MHNQLTFQEVEEWRGCKQICNTSCCVSLMMEPVTGLEEIEALIFCYSIVYPRGHSTLKKSVAKERLLETCHWLEALDLLPFMARSEQNLTREFLLFTRDF